MLNSTYTANAMAGGKVEGMDGASGGHRVCARRGCGMCVKKRTAKYCSVQCCAIDPERLERLRTQARRGNARPLAMSHQLSLTMPAPAYDPEALLANLEREDIPRGMSRLIAS
jgi:hypothetical protein